MGSAALTRTLFDFLYANTSAVALYQPAGSVASQPHLDRIIRDGALQFEGADHRLVEISYTNNNLPQVSLHVSATKNKRLLVYNHGHGGLPVAQETWAREFLQRAYASGYDLLITSMPGAGLNLPDPARNYWAVTWGSERQAPIDQQIFPGWMHAMYEIINDRDSYLHFFIDHMVVLPSVMDARAQAPLRTGRFFASASGFPAPKYVEIIYVGLSGGGATGLTACAVFNFDKCVLVAGFLPEYLRVQQLHSWGDAEQVTRSFYSEFPNDSLLRLAEATTRKMVYIYNRHDPCCYRDPLATRFQQDYPALDIRLTDLNFHGYDVESLMRELTLTAGGQ